MNVWEKIQYEYHKGGSAIRQIIIINLGVFIFSILVGVLATLMNTKPDTLLSYFYLSSDIGVVLMRPWTIITNIFFHAGFMHILGNMLLLFFIGNVIENILGRKRTWHIFLFGGLAGAFLYLVSYNVFPVFAGKIGEIKGASGGVTAILAAAGLYLPFYAFRPFGLFNIEMRWVALIFIFRDLYSFPGMENLGGLIAHLGGAIFGGLYILHLQGKINLPSINLERFKRNKPNRRVDERKTPTKKAQKKAKPNQEEIDAILDKISQSGYDSLSSEEKETLFKASN